MILTTLYYILLHHFIMKNIDTPISKITLNVGAKHLRNGERKIRSKWNKPY